MEIKQKNLNELKPYANNARTHSAEQVAEIQNSINEWGWTTPILISPDDTIIAGHGRYQAAVNLGLTEVPVIVADGWTETQIKAYIIADNKIAQNAGWDFSILKSEIEKLSMSDFDVSLTGFDVNELSLENDFDFSDDSYQPTNDAPEFNQEIIQYVMIFDDQAQQEAWHNFLAKLKDQYGGEMTHSSRVYEYLRTNGF